MITGRPNVAKSDNLRFRLNDGPASRVFAKSCAAAIILAALVTPTCCLDGAHMHGGGLDGFGAICLTGAAPR
jgi:hypothetical protein